MNIKPKNELNVKMKKLEDMEYGTIFTDGLGNHFIYTDNGTSVNLSNGSVENFEDDRVFVIVKAELTVEY